MCWSILRRSKTRSFRIAFALAAAIALLHAVRPTPSFLFPIAEAEIANQPAFSNYITRLDGSPLFLLATNYEGPSDRSWKMWQDGQFDAGLIEQDFVRAKAAGLNALRIFIQAPLPAEVQVGKWGKLDAVVALGQKYNLPLIITFADYTEPDLGKIAAVDRLIAQRYANQSAVLAYDLRNEPHFEDLGTAIYPSDTANPLVSDALIKQYGEIVSQAAVNSWRLTDDGKAIVPARFTPTQAYYYTNSYRTYLQFVADAGAWVAAHNYNLSVLDYIASNDSAKWGPLLQTIDSALAAWIAPQLNAVRAVDAKHPTTIGYSDAVLASLDANSALSFQAIHRYTGTSVKELNLLFALLQNLKASFPNQPLVLEEFGYSNDTNSPAASAIYETALYLYLWKERLAGGAKWMLNDLSTGWDAKQMNFGLYKASYAPKPVAAGLRALGDYIQRTGVSGGNLAVETDGSGSLRYVYTARDALFVSGANYSDQRLSVQADGPAQVFVSWYDPAAIRISSTAPARIRLNPSLLLGDSGLPNRFSLENLRQGGNTARDFSIDNNNFVSFAADAGESYALHLARSAVDARIQIVWPQNNLPVSQATKANIGSTLFQRSTANAICANWTPTVELWRSINNDVERLVGPGTRVSQTTAGITYNTWQFNDVDVTAANDPLNKYYFRLSVDGANDYGNVWSHGADARTYFPQQDIPTAVGTVVPTAVDGKIEIVWPQNNLPVDQAAKANIAALLFEPGSTTAVSANWNPAVRLWRGLNNDPLEPVAVGQKETKTVGNLNYPIWTFNNIDVSAATNAANRYYFRVTVDSLPTRSNVWSHGVDARTYYPTPQPPTANGGC